MIVRFRDKEYAAPDGSVSFLDFLKGLGAFEKEIVAVKAGGELLDLSLHTAGRRRLSPCISTPPEGTHILRHSTAHVMAQAVKELFPEAKVTIGPAIETGFYYDFDYEPGFTEEDLPRIEERMQEIIDKDIPIARRVVSRTEAIELFHGMGEPFKVELISGIPMSR